MILANLFDRRLAVGACLAISCSGLFGCGKSNRPPGVQTLPVTGKVTLDGKPLANANVVFTTPEGASFGGTTQEDGSYQLLGLAGANRKCAGTCRVIINRFLKPDGTPLSPEEPPAMAFATESLPDRYAIPDKSELKADVHEGGGEFNFDLKSK